jgi:hypothetical protein
LEITTLATIKNAAAATSTTSGSLRTTGGAGIGGNVFAGGLISAVGNITGGNIDTAGLVSASGNVIGGNIVTAGVISAASNIVSSSLISAAGNVVGGNLVTTGTANVTSLAAGNTATVTTANYQIGYRDMPQITSLGTLTVADGGKHYYGSGTITVPTNAAVPLVVGTAVLIIATSATTISVSGGVTLRWGGTSSTGGRTLAQYGVATLVKVATDTWYISGTGLS